MGDPNRRLELRVDRLQKGIDGMVDRVVAKVNERLSPAEQRMGQLEQRVNAVAEASGSALALEALVELVGQEKFSAKMAELAKCKQEEAEAHMAGQVNDALEKGQLKPAEVVGEKSLVVGHRTEGPEGKVSYRVDLFPAPEAYRGKKAGEVVEEGAGKTEIREVYEVVEQAKAEPAAPAQEAANG